MPDFPTVFLQHRFGMRTEWRFDTDIACQDFRILIMLEFFMQQHQLPHFFAQDSTLFFEIDHGAVVTLEIDTDIEFDSFTTPQLFGCHLFETFAYDILIVEVFYYFFHGGMIPKSCGRVTTTIVRVFDNDVLL